MLLLTIIACNQTVLKKVAQEQDTSCENSCQVCQRVVYQLKFQGIADCESSGVCKNTCNKIKDTWGTPWNPFDPFLKDMFGKCEICFRAGHCTISQCKEQERNEIEVINSVINLSHLTGKVNPELLENGVTAKVDPRALPHINKVNPGVQKSLSKSIHDALAIKSTDALVPQVENFMGNYFKKPEESVKMGVFSILNNSPHAPEGVSAVNVSFFNESGKTSQPEAKITKQALGAVQSISKQIDAIHAIKPLAKKAGKKELAKLGLKSAKQIQKAEKKFQKVEKQLVKKTKEITKLVNSNAVSDPQVKRVLAESLGKLKQYTKDVKEVQVQLKQEKKKIARI
jgi:hypothetical protein